MDPTSPRSPRRGDNGGGAVYLIGNPKSIVDQTTIIVKQTVATCTSSVVLQINNNIQLLVTIIAQITNVIGQYQKVMVTLTKTTADISITELVLPV